MLEQSGTLGELQRRLDQAEAALAGARQDLARFADAERIGGLGSWEWNALTRRLWWSDQLYRLLGLEPGGEDPTPELYISALRPEQRPIVEQAMREAAVSGGGATRYRHHIVCPDGQERVLFGRMVSEHDGDGRLLRLVGSAVDITEQDRTQRALRESDARLRMFLAQSTAILWCTDRDLRITFSQGGGLVAAGLRNDEAVGQSLAEAMGSDDPDFPPFAAHLRALQGESSTYEITVAGRDYETRVEPFRAEGGEITGAIGISRDVTERREASRALEASEQHFRSLIENVQDVISVLDEGGTIRYESPAVQRVLGYSAGERIGRSIMELIHPDDLPRAVEALRQSAGVPGARQSVALRARHRDGGWRDLEVVGTNMLQDPAVRGVVMNIRDVTERNQLEVQLRQAHRLESVGKLAGGIAHDFNNLLTVIQGNAQFLLADGGFPPGLRGEAEEIRRAAARAAELTHQLLVFSSRQVPQLQVMDLNEAVSELGRMLRSLIQEDVELEIALDPALARVRADPGQLHQVLVNLVVNARDALSQGGRITIATRNAAFPPDAGRDGAPAVLLSVSDTGVGMSAVVRERAFEPFFTTKPPGEGTGLGLSTVYGIVEQSAGIARLSSEPGAGTTVEIYFPALAPVVEPQAPAPAPQVAAPRAATILLVEDEDAVRGVARKALERAGYQVVAVGHGADALRVVETRGAELDLVVSDVVMPGMSGPELVQRIHELLPDLPVLYISGYTDEAVVRRGIAEGTAELLPKPFAPADLVRRVAALLP